ncbi:hypothetical protein SapgrDRAFT_2050 [Saprospira grandis DSM 2844]|uniref:Uncharacterized protein n=1 Tax=Saprospira grandis DSM 2844 TaxID=694433 RepID=J0P861_9BACT|nr:hypothetical protein [Saprospira grandis]EJF53737.1 hypothetical protein SapgrDRAFT_2050 [Saprospira grandis DSM 2844]
MNNPVIHEQWLTTISKLTAEDYPHWVLFQNGSCVILEAEKEDPSTDDLAEMAIEVLKEQASRPVLSVHAYPEGQLIAIDEQSWLLPAGEGLYTVLKLGEFQEEAPSEFAIWVKARQKQRLDLEQATIIYVNCSQKNRYCS